MQIWILYTFLALITWGLWGFFPKLANMYLTSKDILVWEVIGAILIGFLVLYNLEFKPSFNIKGFIFSVLTGICGTLGMLFFLMAIKDGKISIVVTMTALYPIITIILSYLILKEPVSIKQCIGIVLAILSMVLMTN